MQVLENYYWSYKLIIFQPKYGHEEDTQPVSVTIKFECSVKGIDMEKPKGGFLLGTSPEFEVALYTAALILSGTILKQHHIYN